MYINLRNSSISLAYLLKNSMGDNDFMSRVDELFNFDDGKKICNALNLGRNSINDSRILNNAPEVGDAPYKKCAEYLNGLDDAQFQTVYDEIKSKWQAGLLDLKTPVDCVKMLAENNSFTDSLSDWLTDALDNGEKYLNDILTAFTILAITKNYWTLIAPRLQNVLPTISNFPRGNGYDRLMYRLGVKDDRAFVFNRRKIEGNLPAVMREDGNWKAYVYRRLAGMIRNKITALKLLSAAGKILRESRRYERDEECRLSLDGWLDGISSDILNVLKDCGLEIALKFDSDLKDEPALYGKACFLISEEYRKRGDYRQSLEYLNSAVERDELQAMCWLMKLLIPIENDAPNETAQQFISQENWSQKWTAALGRQLALRLSEMNVPAPIRGEAYYRRYKLDPSNRNFLRQAFLCGFPKEAVDEYNQNIVSYRLNLASVEDKSKGFAFVNVNAASDNPCAQMLEATLPESWRPLKYMVARSDIDALIDNLDCTVMLLFLFADDDPRRNLSDLLYWLEKLKTQTLSCAMFFVRGSSSLLTAPIETALKQLYSTGNKSFIRVQIIDEHKCAAEELLFRHPLYHPLWTQGIRPMTPPTAQLKPKLKFILIGDGGSINQLIRNTVWLTGGLIANQIAVEIILLSERGEVVVRDIRPLLPNGLTITVGAMIDRDDIIEKSIRIDDALYFAIDIADGSDLENIALGIKIREMLIRDWSKNSSSAEPMPVPIAVRCDDPDISFLSRRLKVLSMDSGAAWFNNYRLISYGGRDCFSFDRLVGDRLQQLGFCVHMSYCNPAHDDELAYRAAVESYFQSLYNQESGLAQVLSVPYKLYELSCFEPSLLSSWDITDSEFFLPTHQPDRFNEYDIVSDLEGVHSALMSLQNGLDRLLGLTADLRSLDFPPQSSSTWADLKKMLDGLSSDFSSVIEGQRALHSCKYLKDKRNKLKRHRQQLENQLKKNDPGGGRLSQDEMRQVVKDAEKIIWAVSGKIKDMLDKIKSLAAQEHYRWNLYMKICGWRDCSAEEAKKYITASGIKKQQLHIGKLHPAIVAYTSLDDLAKNLEEHLGERKPFKKNDQQAVFGLGEILSRRRLLSEDHETAKKVRRIFGL